MAYTDPLQSTPNLRLCHLKVVGISFVEEAHEMVTGGADATFLVWHLPNLQLKQRFTRSSASPLVSDRLEKDAT